ncbi:hypothetical protein C7M51_04357 (plasmid) [Mixta intestinalis]|uniref:Uncharacterized protein n=1 Tax=Mixta intestinalis TaxID=1615494 RepID=A0A6P1Q4U1_9GAMM|nr:hypothetical protein C7M51_04357 [Mixta intestinalis]
MSVRSNYRDIAILGQQGAEIEECAGIGYILKSDFNLSPLFFEKNEVEALVLGFKLGYTKHRYGIKHCSKKHDEKIHFILLRHLADEIDNK